jgi:hypothetical protein
MNSIKIVKHHTLLLNYILVVALLILITLPTRGQNTSNPCGASGSNPVMSEITKILDLASNPNAEISGDNELALDGTGKMLLDIKDAVVLTPRAREVVLAASGIVSGDNLDLKTTRVRVRVEITKPEDKFFVTAFLETRVRNQATFLQFLEGKPALAAYKKNLEATNIANHTEGALADLTDRILEISLSFGPTCEIDIIKVKQEFTGGK